MTKRIHKDTRPFRLALIFTAILSLIMVGLAADVYAAAKDRKAPTAPASLQVQSKSDTTVSLGWSPSIDKSGIASYRIYQGTTLSGTSTAPAYTVTGLAASHTYSFNVRAVDNAGNVSAPSNTVTVTTAPATAPPSADPPQSVGKALIGYYTGWSTYSGRQVAELDGSKLTHINYAFANIGPDLRIAVGDSFADVEQRFPDDTADAPFHGNFNQLLKLKQRYPHLKTLISVGGWSWSERFSDVALTDASRTAFADSCVAFILKYGFDGVDIDWEYPVAGGEVDNVRRPEDKHNFTLLMQKLREKLDAQGAKDGKTYLLSFAGGGGTYYTDNVELSLLQQYVDYVNIMSYDVHGVWDAKTGLNAPLYKDPNSGFATDTGLMRWCGCT